MVDAMLGCVTALMVTWRAVDSAVVEGGKGIGRNDTHRLAHRSACRHADTCSQPVAQRVESSR